MEGEVFSREEILAKAVPMDKVNSDLCDRLSCQLFMVHQNCDAPPTQVQENFVVDLKTKEQPYVRRIKVTTKPIVLDMGWIPEMGFFEVKNLTGVNRTTLPTKEQIELEERQYLEVRLRNCSGCFKVGSGQFFAAEPEDPCDVFFAASEGEIWINLMVFPK